MFVRGSVSVTGLGDVVVPKGALSGLGMVPAVADCWLRILLFMQSSFAHQSDRFAMFCLKQVKQIGGNWIWLLLVQQLTNCLFVFGMSEMLSIKRRF